MRIEIKTDADKLSEAIGDYLNKMAGKITNRGRLLLLIGQVPATQIEMCFDRSESPSGKAWAPVKRGGQPLALTGKLKTSFTVRTTRNSVEVGTPFPFAPFLNDGTEPYIIRPKRGRGINIPGIGWRKFARHPGLKARPFMPDDSTLDWEEIRGITLQYLMREDT